MFKTVGWKRMYRVNGRHTPLYVVVVLPHVQENHHTPRIDAVLHLYRQRGTLTKDCEDWKEVGSAGEPLTETNDSLMSHA